jgi:hypothetical protein
MRRLHWQAFVAAILLSAGVAGGNPIPGPLPAHVYLSSERLEVIVSPAAAEFKATFIFSAHDIKDSDKDVLETFMQLPVWFPQQASDDPSVTGFWKTFGTNVFNRLRPENEKALEKAVGLKILVEKQSLPINAFVMLYQNGDQRTFKFFKFKEWEVFRELQEPGYCCLLFRIDGLGKLVQKHVPIVVSYRQPLLKAEGNGRFFYLPIFENLPKDVLTTDTNRYSVTLTAASGCSLTVTNGQRTFKVDAGHSIALAPQDRQAIRAMAVGSQTK